MEYWQGVKRKFQQFWNKAESRKLIIGILLGLALITGIGVGAYRGRPGTEETPVINAVSREEVDLVVQAQVGAVLADLYPWILEGPPVLVAVEPPVSVPEPEKPRPPAQAEPEQEPLQAVSFEHLIWPVQGEIETPFGWYRHPVYGDWRFNAGVEFQVSGDAVRTVLAGEVVSVTSNGLETELVIDHGSGWSSTYRSIKGIAVGPGERVQQNQNIALADSSGLVFFGISHDEEPVNPQAFLR